MKEIEQLKEAIQEHIGIKISSLSNPPQGIGSFVFFIKLENETEYAVKVSNENNNDATVLSLIENSQIDLAVPQLITSFTFEGKNVVVMQKIKSTLLEEIEPANIHRYIPSMVSNLKKIHTIKSEQAGYINSDLKSKSFKKVLLATFNGENQALDWEEIASRDVLDKDIVLGSIEKFMIELEQVDCDLNMYSLLHTDFNQKNLFVDKDSDELTAIIDWGEAMYGHPIFDFARIRMLVWHFNLEGHVLNKYNRLMNYSTEEKLLEMLFWKYRTIEYLAYYSEKDTPFNQQRIKLHQDYLKSL